MKECCAIDRFNFFVYHWFFNVNFRIVCHRYFYRFEKLENGKPIKLSSRPIAIREWQKIHFYISTFRSGSNRYNCNWTFSHRSVCACIEIEIVLCRAIYFFSLTLSLCYLSNGNQNRRLCQKVHSKRIPDTSTTKPESEQKKKNDIHVRVQPKFNQHAQHWNVSTKWEDTKWIDETTHSDRERKNRNNSQTTFIRICEMNINLSISPNDSLQRRRT